MLFSLIKQKKGVIKLGLNRVANVVLPGGAASVGNPTFNYFTIVFAFSTSLILTRIRSTLCE